MKSNANKFKGCHKIFCELHELTALADEKCTTFAKKRIEIIAYGAMILTRTRGLD